MITPHELLEDSFPLAQAAIKPLTEIIRVNPELVEEALELAMVIGINQALKRVDSDKRIESAKSIKDLMGTIIKW